MYRRKKLGGKIYSNEFTATLTIAKMQNSSSMPFFSHASLLNADLLLRPVTDDKENTKRQNKKYETRKSKWHMKSSEVRN